ncbi:MAG: hypothetical protein ABFS32_20900 [Bacteroidota bacterium]
MAGQKSDKPQGGFCKWFRNLSTSKKAILIVMSIWAAQAVPKWTMAITADGQLSAKIMKIFITPRGVE